jgi:hypothetical protein
MDIKRYMQSSRVYMCIYTGLYYVVDTASAAAGISHMHVTAFSNMHGHSPRLRVFSFQPIVQKYAEPFEKLTFNTRGTGLID